MAHTAAEMVALRLVISKVLIFKMHRGVLLKRLDIVEHLISRLVTPVRIFFHRAQCNLLKSFWNLGIDAAR
ncbi:hypothetical protein SDC9_178005 [bioreactor metagenome]|uniref:Uncharacterized protein n=1 Tax=bioreactor metagenome TaxID=1076179 RepID=A0A645H2F9_9ZZZZ